MTKPIIKNIYHMLSYAYRSLQLDAVGNFDSEDFDYIHDLLAFILIRGVHRQVKHGLNRDYLVQTEMLSVIRGKIILSENYRRIMMDNRLVCSYEIFSEDTYHNRIVKFTMRSLLNHNNVKLDNRKKLKRLLDYLYDVSEIRLSDITWDKHQYNQQDNSYKALINICYFIIQSLIISKSEGEYKVREWFNDENLHQLFQRFVLSYYQVRFPELNSKARRIPWVIDSIQDLSQMPIMSTDVSLNFSGKTLIIDTKFYGKTMSQYYRSEKEKFISIHLYQIYAYVKNLDKNDTGNVAGIILYAKTDEEIFPEYEFDSKGNRLSLKTIDLNQDWYIIDNQMQQLIEWLNYA